MFEKEAEEWEKEITDNADVEIHFDKPVKVMPTRKQSFQKGAEFGYNKAKVEVEESYRESLCNAELNLASVTEQLEELEKANEWHYPSKGELPKCDEETQLIFYVNCYYEVGGETLTRKRMVLGYYKKAFLRDDVKLFVEKSRGYEDEHLPQDVITWKEIVRPKEIKEND